MLKPEENERLTRVSRGTPMGELLRRYWQPILLTSELAEKDGAPVRVRVLGEHLIAFRDTEGRVGLVDAYCPHRRAPMFYGRNEECGLRCVYHGWKFDTDGNCVDLPSEPAGSPMKAKVRINAYPTCEKGSAIWAYLGPDEHRPPPPDYEWMRAPETHRHLSKTYIQCNWLQSLEGGLDTSHSSFLHNNDIHDMTQLRARDGAPRIEVYTTDYGYYYVSRRDLKDDGEYVRIYHYVLPWQQLRGGVTHWNGGGNYDVPKLDGHIWVPIDDTQTYSWNWMCGINENATISPEFAEEFESHAGRGRHHLIPGTFRLKRNLSNDHMIDRDLQRTRSYTGIEGINTQDIALQEGMGPIVDRSKEYLGSSDKAIIAMRKLLLDATFAIERGETPKGVDPALHRDVRPYDTVVPRGMKWEDAMAELVLAKW